MREQPLMDCNGWVVNLIMLDDAVPYDPPDGLTFAPEGGHIGDRWDGTRYIRKPVDLAAVPMPVAAPAATSLGDFLRAVEIVNEAKAYIAAPGSDAALFPLLRAQGDDLLLTAERVLSEYDQIKRGLL